MVKRIIEVGVAVLLLLCFTGCCYLSCGNITDRFLNIAERLGRSQLTEDAELIGIRFSGIDRFTGIYTSSCVQVSGRDVIFGGGSIEKREIKLSGKISANSGNAEILVRQNFKVKKFSPQSGEQFEYILDFNGGGNYVMIDYDNFSGSIEMRADYYDVNSWNNG